MDMRQGEKGQEGQEKEDRRGQEQEQEQGSQQQPRGEQQGRGVQEQRREQQQQQQQEQQEHDLGQQRQVLGQRKHYRVQRQGGRQPSPQQASGMGGKQRTVGLERPFQLDSCEALVLNSLELAALVFGGAKADSGRGMGVGGGSNRGGVSSCESRSAAGRACSSGGGSSSSNSDGGQHGCQGLAPTAVAAAATAPPAARPDPRLHHAPSAARWWPMAVRGVRTALRDREDSNLSASLLQRLCLLLQLDGCAEDSELG